MCTLYAYNKNLESVICNLRQEFSVLSNWFYDNYMVLNPGKCHFMLFGVKENEQFDLLCYDITLKHSSHEKISFALMSILLISAKQLTKN